MKIKEIRMKQQTKELLDQIKIELVDDLYRYDNDYESWSEVVLDCPSNTLSELLGQVPEEDMEEVHKEIVKKIRSLK